LRLKLDLGFQLNSLLAYIVVFDPKRVGQLDQRLGRGRDQERRRAHQDAQYLGLLVYAEQRTVTTRHDR
jgi:hypothetical protein